MLSCIYTFAHDLSAYLANIISSLIGNSDFLVLNTAIFLLPYMEKWFNKARSLCPLIWNCCLQIFWLTQLYKPAWWKLENDPHSQAPSQIMDLLNFVLRLTYFQHNGSIYEKTPQLQENWMDTLPPAYTAYDSNHWQSVKHSIVKCLYKHEKVL